METPNYYAIIPADVRYDKRLSMLERLLYGEITALCQQNGKCMASNTYFSKLYGVSWGTISNSVAQLERYGYIQTFILEKNDGRLITLSPLPINLSNGEA